MLIDSFSLGVKIAFVLMGACILVSAGIGCRDQVRVWLTPETGSRKRATAALASPFGCAALGVGLGAFMAGLVRWFTAEERGMLLELGIFLGLEVASVIGLALVIWAVVVLLRRVHAWLTCRYERERRRSS